MFKVANRDNYAEVYTVYGVFEKHGGVEVFFIMWNGKFWFFENADHFVPVGE